MIVNIEHGDSTTRISFSGKDFTTVEDLHGIIATIAAGRYEFQLDLETECAMLEMTENINDKSNYEIYVGRNDMLDPLIEYGEFHEIAVNE